MKKIILKRKMNEKIIEILEIKEKKSILKNFKISEIRKKPIFDETPEPKTLKEAEKYIKLLKEAPIGENIEEIDDNRYIEMKLELGIIEEKNKNGW